MIKVERMTQYSLHLVTDHLIATRDRWPALITQAIEGGVNLVQLRDKKARTRELIDLGLRLKPLLAERGIPLLVNDRVDVALAIEADGVHLGQSDMPYRIARSLLGKNKIIGLSITRMEQAIEAQAYDADYFGVGPIFSTATKPDADLPIGFEGLARIRQLLKKPIIAIGGIQWPHVLDLRRAGADGIATVSAILGADDPKESAQAFKKQLSL
jgi:thiamine-phosphate pyrophosphorylase